MGGCIECTRLGLSYGEILCDTLEAADVFKLGSKERSYLGLSDISFEVYNGGNPEGEVIEDKYQL